LAASGNEEAYKKVADFIEQIIKLLDEIHKNESELLEIEEKKQEKAE
jgi:hypothetical protein